MKAQFLPGPYCATQLSDSFQDFVLIEGHDGSAQHTIAMLPIVQLPIGVVEANSRLLACAPDMHGALVAILEAAKAHRWKVNSDEADVFEQARALLARI